MNNDEMVRVAEQASRGEAYSTLRMSGRRRKSFEVVMALAQHIPENEWPETPKHRRRRPTKEQTQRFESLKKTRDKAAAELGLDPSIIAPRNALEAASVDLSTNALMRWQRRLLGLDPAPAPAVHDSAN